MVPDEIFKGSHFERRFVTRFGYIWEKLAIVAAQYGVGLAIQSHKITGTVKEQRLRRIAQVINELEHAVRNEARRRPSWEAELAYILEGNGPEVPVTVVCDVYVENLETGESFAFELKGPLPNSDQTKVSKEKLLKLYAMTKPQVDGAYFALPYNPFGQERQDYQWSFPGRWFDMQNDTAVLIGREFWEKIGGEGTYQAFIEAVNEISGEYRERIYREFLGIEPPPQVPVRL